MDKPSLAAEHPADRDLADRLAQGDGSALAAAYDAHGAAVHGVGLRITRNAAMAEELTQDVFLHLWERPTQFRPERGTLRSYLTMLAHRRSVDHVRSHASREARELRIMAGQVAVASTEERALANVDGAAVRHRLDSLSEGKRRCVELAYFGGLSFRQVAEHLRIPEGTAKSRIRSALEELGRAT